MYSTKDIINKAYNMLADVSPLKIDCGKLCDKSCCKGEATIGMNLFPGEENFLKDYKDFIIIDSKDNQGSKLLICNGECNRKVRPLACRIFPLFPLVEEREGGLRFAAVFDPRGFNICPLIKDEIELDLDFVRTIRRAARLLCQDSKCKEYLINTSDTIKEIISLKASLTSNKND